MMKQYMKNITAFVLVVVLVFSTMGLGLSVSATGTSNNKISNWGTRDEVCTTLNGTGAVNYYTGSYSYNNLKNQTGDTLENTLKTLMTSTHKYTSSYNDCHYEADMTDCENSNGKVILIYTSYQATMSQWNGWNREHVWPQSLGGGNTSGGGADLHHIRPSDAGVNSSRGNKPYGEVSGGTAKYGSNPANGVLGGYYNSTYFEPLDNVKGDVARICLYMYVRWGSSWGCNSLTEVFQSIDVLLKWCAEDPVDTWEMGRNDAVEDIQGNRNVFIDYPELAWQMLGKTAPANMTTPSGGAGGSGSTSCSHASTEIRNATAATCGVAGYTGDTYCKVCGTKVSTGSTIPATKNHIWGTAVVVTPATETTNGISKSTCTTCGSTKTSTIPATGGGTDVPPDVIGGGTVIAEKTASEMQSNLTSEFSLDDNIRVLFGAGTTNAVYNNGAIRIYQKGGSITITAKNDAQMKTVVISTTSNMNGGGKLTITGGTLVSSDNNALTISVNSGATTVKITCSGDSSSTDRIYMTNLAVEYTSASASTPGETVCNHSSTTVRNAVSATCTTAGYTGDTYCNSCNEKVITGASIPAKGHTEVSDAAVAATCTTAGKTAGKHCSVCGTVTQAQTTIPAKGHSWTNATCTAPKTCSACGASEGAPLGHDYEGGICGNCGASEPTTPCNHEYEGATCENQGWCIHCGEQGGAYGDHSWSEYVTTTPPTATQPGVSTSTCIHCGSTKTSEIPATGEVTPDVPPVTPEEPVYVDVSLLEALLSIESAESRILLLMALGLMDSIYYDLVAG